METVKRNPSYSYKSTIIQIGLCIVGNLSQLSSGLSMGFSAVALPYMLKPGGSVFVTSQQASWIASLAAITVPIGCLVNGPILDRWGRKTGLLLVNLPFFIGWLLIAIQPNIDRIYLGRALTGLGTGLASTPATIYFAEVSTSSLRGFLISGTSIAISTGVLIVYILGYFLKENWEVLASICAIFPVVATALVAILVPESPEWLLSKGRSEEACMSLRLIRGVSTTQDVQEELDLMTGKQRSNRRQAVTLMETLSQFVYPQVYKPFIIMNMFFFFQQFSGIFVIIFYAVQVVRNSGIQTDPFLVSIMIGLIRLIFTVLAAWSSKRFGRRPTAIVSGCGMTASLFLLVAHLYSQSGNTGGHLTAPVMQNTSLASFNLTQLSRENSTIANGLAKLISTNSTSIINKTAAAASSTPLNWIPLVALLLYVLSSTIGFLTLPWAMIGEVYPSEVRGMASGMTTCSAYIASFITVKSYPIIMDVLQQHGVFFIFGITAFVGTIFIALFLPETQGKSLREIELYFTKKGSNRHHKEEKDEIMQHVRMPVIIQSKENKRT